MNTLVIAHQESTKEQSRWLDLNPDTHIEVEALPDSLDFAQNLVDNEYEGGEFDIDSNPSYFNDRALHRQRYDVPSQEQPSTNMGYQVRTALEEQIHASLGSAASNLGEQHINAQQDDHQLTSFSHAELVIKF